MDLKEAEVMNVQRDQRLEYNPFLPLKLEFPIYISIYMTMRVHQLEKICCLHAVYYNN